MAYRGVANPLLSRPHIKEFTEIVGMSVSEFARRHNTSPQTVKSALDRGFSSLVRRRGASKTHPLYHCYSAMIERCYSKTCKDYKNYGGRGIRVCGPWFYCFRSFVESVGERPSPLHSLERVDNNLGYYPENVVWGTPSQQSRNRRSTKLDMMLARQVRDLCAKGEDYKSVAERLSIPYREVIRIKNDKRWRE